MMSIIFDPSCIWWFNIFIGFNTIFIIMREFHDFEKIQFKLNQPDLYHKLGNWTFQMAITYSNFVQTGHMRYFLTSTESTMQELNDVEKASHQKPNDINNANYRSYKRGTVPLQHKNIMPITSTNPLRHFLLVQSSLNTHRNEILSNRIQTGYHCDQNTSTY